MPSKNRIIPTILTDGVTVVKGEKFYNWRTVGDAQAVARLYGARDVDEMMFLDVSARSKESHISLGLISHFAETLSSPFSVGGGISDIEIATKCMRAGAEKIVLGTSAIETPQLISQVADKFGTQAVTVAVDILNLQTYTIATHSGSKIENIDFLELIVNLESLGAGELLIQSVENDGTLSGHNPAPIKSASEICNLPIIASGGISSAKDVQNAIENGANAVSVGALFQFTENTPRSMAIELQTMGIPVRRK